MTVTAEIQRGFITHRLPRMGAKVELLCAKDGSFVRLALLCTWSEDGWIVSGTKRRIGKEVVGWRPFAARNLG